MLFNEIKFFSFFVVYFISRLNYAIFFCFCVETIIYVFKIALEFEFSLVETNSK